MKAVKDSVLNEPSKMTQSSIPSREIAGRIEYLEEV